MINNLSVFKRLGRIQNVHKSKLGKNGVNIIVGTESVTLYFNEYVNLPDQKLKISNKVNDLRTKIIGLKKKLANKSFLKNAPKTIIQKEKISLDKYNIELKKLNSVLNSIKN